MCLKNKRLRLFCGAALVCKACLCLCKTSDCTNWVDGTLYCYDCRERKRYEKNRHRDEHNTSFVSFMMQYDSALSSFGIRLNFEVSKGKTMIVSSEPIFTGSDCDAINAWMGQSTHPIEPINWDRQKNDYSRYYNA